MAPAKAFKHTPQLGASERSKKIVRAVSPSETERLARMHSPALPKRLLKGSSLSFYRNLEGETFAAAKKPYDSKGQKFDITVYSLGNRKASVRTRGTLRVEGNSLYIYDLNPGRGFWSRDYSRPKPSAKGRFLFRVFVEEALRTAKRLGLQTVTVDTGSERLASYYKEFGFRLEYDLQADMWSGRLAVRR